MPDSTPDPAVVAAASNTDRFYTEVKSLHEFDKLEVRCVVDTLLSKTEEETCYLATYIRTISNVESLLALKGSKDVQAIAMISRALFELAVDLRLLEATPAGWIRMIAHSDVQKLRVAKRIIEFKNANPDVRTDLSVYQKHIDQNSTRVAALQKSIWPNIKSPKHWSGMNLADRCTALKSPFDQIYAEDYARLSWYVHPGLAGITHVPHAAFIHVCGYAYHLSARAYEQALLTVIRIFKLSKGNRDIENRLDAAMKFPFTDTDEQVLALRQRAGL